MTSVRHCDCRWYQDEISATYLKTMRKEMKEKTNEASFIYNLGCVYNHLCIISTCSEPVGNPIRLLVLRYVTNMVKRVVRRVTLEVLTVNYSTVPYYHENLLYAPTCNSKTYFHNRNSTVVFSYFRTSVKSKLPTINF